MENNRNNITELVFILDRSGSMSGLEADTIGGFNSMIAKQKQQEGKVYVSTVLFDNDAKVLHDRVGIETIPPMTEKDYSVGGCTALMDALGGAIHHIANIHRYGRREDVPEHTIFVITTDGMENASRKYSADRVRQMIQHEQEKYGWEFLFLAANIDAAQTAERFGIRRERASRYRASEAGTRHLYACVSDAVMHLRQGEDLEECWNAAIESDAD